MSWELSAENIFLPPEQPLRRPSVYGIPQFILPHGQDKPHYESLLVVDVGYPRVGEPDAALDS